ncbi:hypothetical protein QIS74_10035 [Colletotrichum tabaci]|uniref:Secreted protein n=1 Tax=Colletotrichum tabaci TaxID=1209068 RepID=A0AAV9T282_9PEZI
MKLLTLSSILFPLTFFANSAAAGKHRYNANRNLQLWRVPVCAGVCMKELEWRLNEKKLPLDIITWCDKTSPPHRPDWVDFGRKLDECKSVQCTDVRYWYDFAEWHWKYCSWHENPKASMAFVNDYRISAWWPNNEGRPRPPGHESWISENRTSDATPR